MTTGTPSAPNTIVEQDGIGDWRIHAASRIVTDVPAAFPGGPSHKAGTVAYLTTMAANAQHPLLSFITPNAAALALDAGFRSADRASILWSQVVYQKTITPEGPGSSVTLEHLVALFDYFEEAQAAANSSFQAVEAFANETIARLLTGTMPIPRRKGPREMTAEEIERQVSTEEKIGDVLPRLLNVPSIKGGREWPPFTVLKDIRHASTHFKSGDQYPLSGKVATDSLYHILLNNAPRQFPVTATRIISWFVGNNKPRWLSYLVEKHAIS
jgi:hypothetical protein